MLQVTPDAYGFGYVHVYDTGDLAARAMLRICPPWDLIPFGPDGRAQRDFDCVVIGFGRYGQAALKRLVMNAQFAGSSFHAAVFSPNAAEESGYLVTDSSALFTNYDISLIAADGRSRALYEYILDYARTKGCYNVTLNVWNCNPGAMAFYEKLGLAPYKVGMEKILAPDGQFTLDLE